MTSDAAAPLSPGHELGGFLIEAVLGQSAGGTSYLARDPRGQQAMTIKTVSVAQDETYQALRAYVQRASQVQHRNLARVFGVGREGNMAFVVMEYVDGQSLAATLAQRRAQSDPFGKQTAFNILAHLCGGIQALHAIDVHGVLTPENVYVTRNGRFKITNLAYGRYVAEQLYAQGRGMIHESGFVAPEVRQDPSRLSPSSDIFSLAMLAAELLSPQPLHALSADTRRAALEIGAQLGPATFAVLERALSLDPAARPTDAGELREQLHVLTDDPEARRGGEAVTPVNPMPAITAAQAPMLGDGEEVMAAALPSLDLEPDPSVMVPSLPTVIQEEERRKAQAEEDDPFAAAARALGGPRAGGGGAEDTGEKRYLVSRNGLDYGPYSGQEVLAQLHRDEINEHTAIMDRVTQFRTPLGEMAEFFDAVREYIPKREARRRREAETRAQRIQTAKKAGKWTGVVGAVAALAIFGVWLSWWLFVRPKPAALPAEQMIASLGESYRMEPPPREFAQIALDADLVKDLFAEADPAAPKSGGRRPGIGARRAGAGGAGGDDDENITTLDLDSEGGTDHVLTDGEVQSTVRRHSGALGGCLREELKRNPGFKGVSIQFFIKPTGTTGGVKIDGGGSGALDACLKGHVRNMKFPQHGGFNRGVTLPFYIK
jgi:hypothetical protein